MKDKIIIKKLKNAISDYYYIIHQINTYSYTLHLKTLTIFYDKILFYLNKTNYFCPVCLYTI